MTSPATARKTVVEQQGSSSTVKTNPQPGNTLLTAVEPTNKTPSPKVEPSKAKTLHRSISAEFNLREGGEDGPF